MAQIKTIESQERSERSSELDRLDIFVGKWMNEGYTVETAEAPSVRIATSDIYEWLPGKFFVLHTAYGRIGTMNVGGTEILGYDPASGRFIARFFDSRGNVSESSLTSDGDSWTWRGETTGCAAVFSDGGNVQTAHHVRLNANGEWTPSMEVVLTKVT